MSLSRRGFLFVSSGAVAGSMLVAGERESEATQIVNFSDSGLVTGKPKPLRHKEIPGFLSAKQIAPHHAAHYGGALRGYSSIDAKLESRLKKGEAIDPSAYGAMQRAA